MPRLLLHSYGQFDRRHAIAPVMWPHFDLLHVHAGRLRLRVNDAPEFHLKSGESVLIFPHTSFSGGVIGGRRVRASVQHFALEEPVDSENAVLGAWAGKKQGFALLAGPNASSAGRDVERALELATHSASAVNTALRAAQLTLLLGRFLQAAPSRPPPETQSGESLHQIMIWARTRGGVVTVEEMARRAGYSAAHFRLLFAAAFNTRPAAFLLRLRMNEAQRLLRETRKAIKEIAGETGYADAVAFHRAFARRTGRTPASYRRQFAPRG
jgi:AraC-like DNA-binding protein